MREGFEEVLSKVFPYESFRQYQKDCIRFIHDTIAECKIGLLSSPTGTGKSISALSAFLVAFERGVAGRLLVATRTKSQLEIYAKEAERISDFSDVMFSGVVFKSRQELCPLCIKDERLRGMGYSSFLRYCRRLRDGGGCKYYEESYVKRGIASRRMMAVLSKFRRGVARSSDIINRSMDLGVCPYEVAKRKALTSDMVIGSYNYILMPEVRKVIISRMSDVDCVLDESHTLPEYSSGLFSDESSTRTIDKAIRECEEVEVDSSVLEAFREEFLGRAEEAKDRLNEAHVVNRDEMLRKVMEKSLIRRRDQLLAELSLLVREGEAILDERLFESESGRATSHLLRCSEFLYDWVIHPDEGYAYYVIPRTKEDEFYARIGFTCLDPSLAVSEVVRRLRSAILMSGTLWNMDYYASVLGIDKDRVRKLSVPSPFPRENRLMLIDKAVTTKYEMRDEKQLSLIRDRLAEIVKAFKGRAAVFFPSYELMSRITSGLKPDAPTLFEDEGTKIEGVMEFLEKNEDCLLFGVARGKLSEGVDMATEKGGLLSGVIIVGLPYPKRDELQEELLKFFKRRFGHKAFEYAYVTPMMTALAQAVGRLIRSERDRGVVVIMDRRMLGEVRRRFPSEFLEGAKAFKRLEEITREVGLFLKADSRTA